MKKFFKYKDVYKRQTWDYEDLADMLDWDAVDAFRRRSLNPEHPVLRGSAQDVYKRQSLSSSGEVVFPI